jgi:predicted dehydrogenase
MTTEHSGIVPEKIGVAVLGAGERARGVVKNLIRDSAGGARVVSVYDPDAAAAEEARRYWDASGACLADTVDEALRTPGAQWAMIFSPNAFHREQILAAFAAGLHVFSEKPLATTIEDCVAIHEAHARSGRLFATGFVLRYAPLYREIKRLLEFGGFGPIVSISASENITPAHGGYIMANWRRHTRIAGPHILEKCCHDLDLINWFCDDLPRRAAAFGGLDVFTPDHQWMFEKYGGAGTFLAWRDPHRAESPFTSEKDLMDNLVGLLEYRRGPRVTFQATMCNAIPERRMYIACLEGTLIGELYSGRLQCARIGESPREIVLPGGGHGGGDEYIMKELWETMTRGTPPKCGGEEGLRSAVVALALDQAAREGRTVDLEPIWSSLGR